MNRSAGGGSGARSTKWLLRDPSRDAGALLFALPYLGAGASMYHGWPRRLGPVEICPVQLPGREDRLAEPHIAAYGELGDRMVEALAPFLDRPFAFFGHCASAYLGFEASLRTVDASGRPPSRLFVSSMFAVHESHSVPILGFGQCQVRTLAKDLIASRHGSTEPELLDMAVEAITADLESYRAYAGCAELAGARKAPCPISVIGWDRDEFVPASKLCAWDGYAADVDRIVLPGDHWSFLEAPSQLHIVIETLLAG